MEPVWSSATEVSYKGAKVAVQVAKGEILSNDWIEYHIKSEDDAFRDIMGENEIKIAIKPSLPYTPDNDLVYEQRTPEQTILVKEIWNFIRQLHP